MKNYSYKTSISKFLQYFNSISISKSLFVKHWLIRILIAANLLMLYSHHVQNQKLELQLTEAAKPVIQSSFQLSDLPPIMHEAMRDLVADDMAKYRYDVARESWPYLQNSTRKFVIENLAENIEKIDSVDERIAALEDIMKLTREWQMLFSEKYNRFNWLSGDPFDISNISYYDLLVIQKWQVKDEMKYLAYVNQRGLAHRYCLYLKGESADRKKFCEYLMVVHNKNAKTSLGYPVLIMYFVNWPSDEPITYDEQIPIELIESALTDAVKFLIKHGLSDSAGILEKHLNKLTIPGK